MTAYELSDWMGAGRGIFSSLIKLNQIMTFSSEGSKISER